MIYNPNSKHRKREREFILFLLTYDEIDSIMGETKEDVANMLTTLDKACTEGKNKRRRYKVLDDKTYEIVQFFHLVYVMLKCEIIDEEEYLCI